MSSEVLPSSIPCYQGISEFLSAKTQGQFVQAAIGKTALTLISWAIARMFERALSYCSLAFSSRSSSSSSEAPCLIKHGQPPWKKEEIQNPDFFARSCSAFSTDSSLRWRSSTDLGFSTRSQYSAALSVHAYVQRKKKRSFEGWFGQRKRAGKRHTTNSSWSTSEAWVSLSTCCCASWSRFS